MDILEILYILVTYEISDIYNIFDKVWRCIRKLAHFGQIDNSGHICIFRHSSNFGCIDLWKSFSNFGHFGHIHHIWHKENHIHIHPVSRAASQKTNILYYKKKSYHRGFVLSQFSFFLFYNFQQLLIPVTGLTILHFGG